MLARQSEEEARRQRDAADLQRGIAERNEQQAREQRNQALATQSIYLARVSREASSAGNPTLGALLAMSGLPDETSVHANERERPYVAAAESALAVNFDWLAGARNLADGLGPLLQVRCDGSGSTVAAALADGRIALLGAVGQDVIYTAARHGTPARILAFSPDSRLLLSIAGDDEAMLWNAASGERLATLPPQSGKLVAASFDTQGSQIVTISQDATARFWSLRGEAASTLTLTGGPPSRLDAPQAATARTSPKAMGSRGFDN